MDSSHMEGDLFLAPPPPNVEAIDLGAPLDLCVKRRDRSPEEDVELPTPPKLVRNSAPPSLRPHHQQISKASLEALGVGTTAFEIHQEQIRQLQMISGLFGRALVDSGIPTLPPMPQLKQREQSAVGLTALSETSSLGGFSEDEEAGSSHSQGRKSQDSHSDHEADDASNRGTPNTEELLRKPLLLGFRRETLIKSISKLGVRGEVTYYGPCGKRLKSYPDINRYLQRKGFAAVLARENFTFNNKFNIGDFFEGGYPKDGGCRLSEGEVNQRIDNLRGDSASRKRAAMDRAFQKEREREREKERQKQRELEKEKKKEEQRLEKERRLKALEEEKKRKQAEAESRRQAEILAKVQERELRRQQQALLREQEMAKRREMIAMLDTERERRRQHLGLIQALVLYQKSRDQVREVEPPPEQKAAVEDLELPADPKSRALSLPRLGELRVPASAYANLLLVDEFLTTFQKCIGYKGTIPSRAELEKALVNEGSEDELCSLVGQLLAICIVDPGLQNSRDASTVTGQHLRDITINRFTLTEALRLYFLALDKDGAIYQWVCEKPFLALNPTQKSEIVAFLCNELLSNRSVIRHIDNCTEHLSILRRDRGIVEGELNKLRAVQRVRARRAEEREAANKEEKPATDGGDSAAAAAAPPPALDSPLHCAEEQNSAMSDDQLDGKVAKMEQTQCELSKKILETAAAIRSTMLGQDRYRRRFWILAQNGGIYVESLESAEQDGLGDFDADMLSATDGTEQEINDESGPASDMEEDDDGSQELKKPLEPKKEQTDRKAAVTKTEDEATDHDKENEVKSDALNEMHEIKVEAKAEPVDKPAEEKIETAVVNGDASATKDEVEDPKKVEIKEDSKPKTERMETETGAVQKQEALKAEPGTPANPADPAGQMQAVLRSMGIQDEMAQLLLANQFFTSMLATTMLMQGGNIANMATILGQLHQLATLQKGPAPGSSAGALASNGVTNSANPAPSSATAPMDPTAALAAAAAAAAAATGSSASTSGAGPLNPAAVFHINSTAVADLNAASGPLPQLATSSVATSSTSSTSVASVGAAHAGTSDAPTAAIGTVPPAGCLTSATTTAVPSEVAPPPPTSAEQALKNIAQKKAEQLEQASNGNHRRWFNILPREGCDGSGVVDEPIEEDRDDEEEDESMDDSSEEKRLQTIPQVLRKGWWKITKRSELDDLYKVLNADGYREKYLSESLSKVLMYNPDEVPFGLKGDPNDALSGLDLPAPSPDYEDQWNPKAALKVEIELLNELNSLQERVVQASMQVRGVRNDDDDVTVPKSVDDPAWMASTAFLLHEKYVRAKEEKLNGRQKVKRQRNNKKKSRAERRRLAALAKLQEKQRNEEEEEEEEEKEEDEESDEDLRPPTPPPGVNNPIEVAKERLLNLESAIERRYLRPPLGRGQVPIPHGPTTASSTRGGFNHREEKKDEEDNISRELRRWRDGVAKCTGAAQIHLCLMQLESCIAWEKSIMKANCQFCGSGENEESLLLCDACDKGYHTYCFKPEMVVPQGDWFCFECINSVNLNKVCVICGKPGNTKMAQCDVCPKLFHPVCVNLAKVPPRKWTCVACTVPTAEVPEAETPAPSKKRSSSSRNRSSAKEKKSRSTAESIAASVASVSTNGQEREEKEAEPKDTKDHKDPKDTKESKETKEKEKDSKEKEKEKEKDIADGAPKEKRARKGRASAASLKKQQQASERVLGECKLLLDELCDHDAAWPFLYPVNPKDCPTYRKIIKRPMDLQTVRNKIESGVYNICEDFADDARLMFSNCETFNEPNSPVGKAGRKLRLFFEKRYTEILDNS